MNKIVNKFLLAEEFIPELRLRQPGFTYSVCWCFLNSLKGFKIQRNRRLKQKGWAEKGPSDFISSLRYFIALNFCRNFTDVALNSNWYN